MSDFRVVMVGKTGAGKSATGNTILGQKVFKHNFSSESMTKRCQQHQQIVESGQIISMIDTPGLYDTKVSEEELKDEIVRCVYMSAPGPHVFLLVVRLDVRFIDEEKKTVKWIQKNFGEDAARYTIILFTRGDQLDTSIEKFLTDNKQIKELVSKCKGGYHVFNNKDEENRTQVTELLKKIERIVKKNGGEHYKNEMYKEAQRKLWERQREELERQKLEEEQKNSKINKAKKAALVALGGAAIAVGSVVLSPVALAITPLALVAGGGAYVAEKCASLIADVYNSRDQKKDAENGASSNNTARDVDDQNG